MGQDEWTGAIAGTIRAERAAARLSQAELARKAGIPRMTYIRYESAERSPNFAQLLRTATALGIPIATFTQRIEDRAKGQ